MIYIHLHKVPKGDNESVASEVRITIIFGAGGGGGSNWKGGWRGFRGAVIILSLDRGVFTLGRLNNLVLTVCIPFSMYLYFRDRYPFPPTPKVNAGLVIPQFTAVLQSTVIHT